MENVNLGRTVVFNLKQKGYSINYPTIGQLWDIESLRAALSKGQYGNMIDIGTNLAFSAVETIDICAKLYILCPDVIKDLGVDIKNIDAIDFKEIRDAFREQLTPWFNAWQELFSKENEKK